MAGSGSRVIIARLNSGNEPEREALEIYDAQVKKGNEARDIVTNALLRLGGVDVEQFRKPGDRHTKLDSQILDMKASLDNLVDQVQGIQEEVAATPDLSESIAGIQDGIDAIRQRQEAQLKELLDAMRHLRRSDPEGFRNFANSSDDEDGGELSPTFIQNAGKALKPSFRQKQGGDD